ncbi:hypothetical protein ISCGN_023625 [Ixodes scapularis]
MLRPSGASCARANGRLFTLLVLLFALHFASSTVEPSKGTGMQIRRRPSDLRRSQQTWENVQAFLRSKNPLGSRKPKDKRRRRDESAGQRPFKRPADVGRRPATRPSRNPTVAHEVNASFPDLPRWTPPVGRPAPNYLPCGRGSRCSSNHGCAPRRPRRPLGGQADTSLGQLICMVLMASVGGDEGVSLCVEEELT